MTMKRQGATAYNSNLGAVCPCCGQRVKVRHREFSLKAWAYLVANNEIALAHVGEATCDACYTDMREFLMDSITAVESFPVSKDLQRKLSVGLTATTKLTGLNAAVGQ